MKNTNLDALAHRANSVASLFRDYIDLVAVLFYVNAQDVADFMYRPGMKWYLIDGDLMTQHNGVWFVSTRLKEMYTAYGCIGVKATCGGVVTLYVLRIEDAAKPQEMR